MFNFYGSDFLTIFGKFEIFHSRLPFTFFETFFWPELRLRTLTHKKWIESRWEAMFGERV